MIIVKTAFFNWYLRSDNYQKFLASDAQFDVVAVESGFCEELFGLGQHFNAPLIVLSAAAAVGQMGSYSAIPTLSSYMPNILDGYSDNMTFLQRLKNMIRATLIDLAAEFIAGPATEKRYEKMFSNARVSVKEIKQNVSLMLMNSHPVLTGPKPLPHNVIEVGGMSLNPYNQVLSQSFKKILNDATNGAIYFSFGSLVNASAISTIENAAISKIFTNFPNITVLYKNADAQPFANNKNIHTSSWLPQRAILAHPNVKAFITHGGLNSIQECIYFGKPLIVIPFFCDQGTNGQFAADRGYGINIPIWKLTEDNFKEAIHEILYNPRLESRISFI